MPTGYTAPIFEDPDFTFTDFAWRCARTMGVCVEMRDEPMDKRPPHKFEVPQYELEGVPKAEAALLRARSITPEQAATEAKADFIAQMENWAERVAKAEQNAERVAVMQEAVNSWKDPDPMEGLKSFMWEQLQTSAIDCKPPTQPQQITGEQWRHDRITGAEWDLAYAHEKLGAAIKQTSERNEYLRRLQVALGEEVTT